MDDETNSLGCKLLSNIDAEFRNDPLINEYDVLPVKQSCANRNPIIVVDHKLGIESWAVRLLFSSASLQLREWCARRNKIHNLSASTATDLDWLCSVTRVILLAAADHMTAWNIRKELVRIGKLDVSDDLRLGELILGKHPKSSETFSHRKWLLERWFQRSHSASSNNLKSSQACQSTSANDLHAPCTLSDNTPLVAVSSRCLATHKCCHVLSISNCRNSATTASRTHSEDLHKLSRHELQVCHRAADRYHSNYVAWTHRQWVLMHFACCQSQLLEEELSCTQSFVCCHVSDHSGFHYRQRLLTCLPHTDQTQDLLCDGDPKYRVQGQTDPHPQCDVKDSLSCKAAVNAELQLTEELIVAYPGHEAVWYHRRFILFLRASRFTDDNDVSCESEVKEDQCADHVGPHLSKIAKLQEVSQDKKNNFLDDYDNEKKFCETLLANSSDDKSWHATLIQHHSKWLEQCYRVKYLSGD